MKTYLFDTIDRIKRYSRTLDVKTDFCNKSWWAFNDTGDKTLYIMQEDGSFYVTVNGKGIKGSWDFIAANNTIIFNYENNVLMFHPEFMDDNLLCLNLDGTKNYAFLIEEKNLKKFAPDSLMQLRWYFKKKEDQILHQEQLKMQQRQAEFEKKKREEEEKQAQERKYKESREYKEITLKKSADELRSSIASDWKLRHIIIFIVVISLVIGMLIGCTVEFFEFENYGIKEIGEYIGGLLGSIWIAFMAFLFIDSTAHYNNVEKWKKQHPNDPRSKYL